MKKPISLAALLLPITLLTGCQSTTPYVPTIVTNVVEVEKNQTEIYNRTRQWFSEYFVSGESVIDYEDPSSGTIIGKGIANIGTGPFGLVDERINFTLRVDTKDNKFKTEYKINKHTNYDSTNGVYDVFNVTEERNQSAKKKVESITSDLKNYVAGGGVDW